MRFRVHPSLCYAAVGIVLTQIVAGCNRGAECVVVAGTATYRGQPIAEGSIGFYPCDGTEGSPTIVPVKDGNYRAESHGGVPVGSYRVVILAVRKAPNRSTPANVNGDMPPLDSVEQYLPAKYNAKTELKTTVDSGCGPLTRDFTLGD